MWAHRRLFQIFYISERRFTLFKKKIFIEALRRFFMQNDLNSIGSLLTGRIINWIGQEAIRVETMSEIKRQGF